MSGRFSGVLGGIEAKRRLANEAGDAVAAGVNARQGVTGLMHPAAVRGDHLPPTDHRQFVDADDNDASRAGPSAPIQAGLYPHTDIHTTVTRDTGIRAQDDDVGQSAYNEYASNVGPQLPTRQLQRAYQRDGRDVGAGYINNPFDEQGREQIGRQFWHAPLGGHVRSALEGQELLGHRISRGQARMAEQGLAGLTAVGIGVPAFLAAVNQLSTPQDQGVIPLA